MMKRDRWDLERKPLEGPWDQCKTRSFIRSRVELERTHGDGCMSVEAGKPKHKRQHQETEFAKNEKEVEDSGVASSICMSARNRTSIADEVRYKGGGSNPPPVPPTVSRDEPPKNISSRASLLASNSYHITAVLKRKPRYDELMGRPSKIERTQCSSSGASSANLVGGRGSPQTPPDTEVAYCTNPNCTDSK